MKSIKNFAVLVFCAAVLASAVVWAFRREEDRMRQVVQNSAQDTIGQLGAAAGKAIGKIGSAGGGNHPGTAGGQGRTSPADDLEGLLGAVLGSARDVLTGDSSASGSPGNPSSPSRDPVGDLFTLGQKIAKTGDSVAQEIVGLTTAEEQAIGRETHDLLRKQHRLVQDSTLIERLRRLAEPILQQRTRKDSQYTILVVDDPGVNAFAHLGGYVYVNRGVFTFAQSDAELEFIVGHEIGHVDLGHCRRQMTYVARAGKLGGQIASQLAQAAYVAIALGYSEDAEFEADAHAFRTMLRLGRSRDQGLTLTRHFLQEKPQRKEPQPTGEPLEQTIRAIDRHFRSHPPMSERLARLESLSTRETTTP